MLLSAILLKCIANLLNEFKLKVCLFVIVLTETAINVTPFFNKRPASSNSAGSGGLKGLKRPVPEGRAPWIISRNYLTHFYLSVIFAKKYFLIALLRMTFILFLKSSVKQSNEEIEMGVAG